MTPQEQQMIDGLIGRLRSTPVQSKDAEAEQHIQQGLANFPDALYVLVQTVLVQQYGLQQAQSQLNELKQQNGELQSRLEQAAQASKSAGGSFLSHIFGSSNSTPSPTTQPPQYQPVNNPGTGGYAPAAPPPPYPGQGYPTQGYPTSGGMFGSSGGGGFLQGAMQTAAGVAAGEMMFQGMEDLFHGFGRGGSERGFDGGGGGVVNNYYDDDRNSSQGRDATRDDSNFYNPDNDASRNDAAAVDQGGSDLGSFGGNAADFSSTDSSSDLSFDNSADNTDFNDTSDFGGGGFDDNSGGGFSDNS